MALVFDFRPQVMRWRDSETGQFAKKPRGAPPPPPIPEWEIQIEYDYRAFGAVRVSPPLSDKVPIPWIGQKPNSADVLGVILQHEAEFRAKRVYVFNQSSIVIPMNESARREEG